jgi:hypothetical protein
MDRNMDRNAERTILVTGGDKAYFLMGCMLVHSLRKFAPRLPVYFLDFGLERAQRKFLDTICTVVARPRHLDPAQHHYASKASMGEFLRDVPWSTLVWLDSDMIAVSPLADDLKAVLRDMAARDSDIAACADSCPSIGAFIAKGAPVASFAAALTESGVASGEPYLNVGFVVCRSQAFLDAWRKLTDSFTPHMCFEQNAFNIVTRNKAKLTILPAAQWNVHGHWLKEKSNALGGSHILHATSERAEADLTNNEFVAFGTQRIMSTLKLFRDPNLRKLQEAVLMDFMAGAHRPLQQLGILV